MRYLLTCIDIFTKRAWAAPVARKSARDIIEAFEIVSADDGSAATLVHDFVTSRVDYCNALYAGAPKTVSNKLQRVLNAAARVASDTRKIDRGLTTLLHDELHWLDVQERVTYKLSVMMYHCLHGLAPRYLADHLTPASDVASRLRLLSANRHQLLYLAVDSIHTAVERFRLPVRRSGIRCRAS